MDTRRSEFKIDDISSGCDVAGLGTWDFYEHSDVERE